jgi:hypothetical protein
VSLTSDKIRAVADPVIAEGFGPEAVRFAVWRELRLQIGHGGKGGAGSDTSKTCPYCGRTGNGGHGGFCPNAEAET